MPTLFFTSSFSRRVKRLEPELQEEVLLKIDWFRNPKNWGQLKVHKLGGKLKSYYSSSVNYKIRTVFRYLSKNEIVLVAIGDHDIYK